MSTKTFDMTKLFDPELALTQAEKHTKSYISFIADKTVRESTESITSATFDFARAQMTAYRTWGDSVQKIWQV